MLACDIEERDTGARERHTVAIDTTAGTVRDRNGTWRDGAPSPWGPDLEQFVRTEAARATWGNRRNADKASVGTFTLDLATGAFAVESMFRDRVLQGRCHREDGSI